ncbi:unnamed protein product [Mytilus coruscus]|uniref:Tyr recombinase domain-containing protein n=1 Tax=Mytilus coruscus TaxID=42192 RepID=A0A6J8CGY6_MYTCO|nr:unnamed protein product [Mytilus coruscus]
MEDVPLAVHGSVQNRPTLPLSTTPSLGYFSTTLCPTAGVRSDAFSNVDIVAPSLQRSIIEDDSLPKTGSTGRAAPSYIYAQMCQKLNNILCPYTTLKNYLQLRSVKGKCALTDPLFINENFSALERKCFIRNLKILLEACGYQAALYNGHSFRIGAATSAGKANIEDHLIKNIG